MYARHTLIILISSIQLLFVGGCLEPQVTTKEQDEAALREMYEEVLSTASQDCANVSSCKAMGIGYKSCGGYPQYVIYSVTSTDTALLKIKATSFTQADSVFDTKWGLISNCELISPPDSFECRDNKCYAFPESSFYWAY